VRIALIPTGKMELHGLERCLGRLFPHHEFVVVEAERDPYDRPIPFNGFTSSSLPTPLRGPADAPSNLTKLVQAMAAELEPGRGDDRSDLCMVLDDLELANVDRPERVVAAIRHEVRLHLDELHHRRPTLAPRVARALLDGGSFHFAVPMIEAWLFADPACLTAAGVPGDRPTRLTAGRDPEQFLTDDPDFTSADDAECVVMARKRRRRRAPWIRADRALHPKAYLGWLCRDPSLPDCTSYRESDGGAAALRRLDWPTVARRPEHMRYARALLADLADKLDTWPSTVTRIGEEAPLTSVRHAPKDRVLRNM
jgi:hypothetical protein